MSEQNTNFRGPAFEVYSTEGSDPADMLPRPRAIKVWSLLVVTAVLFSYLGAYAVAGVLANADLIAKWSPAADPRPKWMLVGFVVMVAAFLVAALAFRIASSRNLREIDKMGDEVEEVERDGLSVIAEIRGPLTAAKVEAAKEAVARASGKAA